MTPCLQWNVPQSLSLWHNRNRPASPSHVPSALQAEVLLLPTSTAHSAMGWPMLSRQHRGPIAAPSPTMDAQSDGLVHASAAPPHAPVSQVAELLVTQHAPMHAPEHPDVASR